MFLKKETMKSDSLDSSFVSTRFHQVPSNRILTKLTLRFHLRSLSVHCEFFENRMCFTVQLSMFFAYRSLKQLIYNTKSFSTCQELFLKNFEVFWIGLSPHRSDFVILSHSFLFVNNYFLFFQNFSNCWCRRNNFLRQLS